MRFTYDADCTTIMTPPVTPLWKKFRNIFLFLLTIGASLTLGLLSFSGMFVLWPIIPLAIASFILAVAYEGEIFWQNIKGAIKTLFSRDALKIQLLREFLHDNILSKDDKDLPILLKDYLMLVRQYEELAHHAEHHSPSADDLHYQKLLKDKIKRFELEFARHLFNLNEKEEKQSEAMKELRAWFEKKGGKSYLNKYRLRSSIFVVGGVFSIVAGACIAAGTGYLLFDTFMTLPFLAAVPAAALPAIILSLAVVSGVAYALITYNSITAMINNRTLQKLYTTLKTDFQTKGLCLSNVVKGLAAMLFIGLTVALTVFTGGTWWTIGQNLNFLFHKAWILGCTICITLATFVINLFNTLCTWLGLKQQIESNISEVTSEESTSNVSEILSDESTVNSKMEGLLIEKAAHILSQIAEAGSPSKSHLRTVLGMQPHSTLSKTILVSEITKQLQLESNRTPALDILLSRISAKLTEQGKIHTEMDKTSPESYQQRLTRATTHLFELKQNLFPAAQESLESVGTWISQQVDKIALETLLGKIDENLKAAGIDRPQGYSLEVYKNLSNWDIFKLGCKQAWRQFTSAWGPIDKHDHPAHQYNPFRFILITILAPINLVLFLVHVISIGVTGDQMPGVDPALSAAAGAANDFVEDYDRIIGHGHSHARQSDRNILQARSESGGGHEHGLDLPKRFIQLLLTPLYLLAILYDFFVMLHHTPKEELTFQKGWTLFKNACVRQYTNQSVEEHHHCFADEAKQLEEGLSLEAQKLDAQLLVKPLKERFEVACRDQALANKKHKRLVSLDQKIEKADTKENLYKILTKAPTSRTLSKQRYLFIQPPKDRITNTVESLRHIPHQVSLRKG